MSQKKKFWSTWKILNMKTSNQNMRNRETFSADIVGRDLSIWGYVLIENPSTATASSKPSTN